MKKIIAFFITLIMLLTLFVPALSVSASETEADADIVFEIGDIIYDSALREFEVPLMITKNDSNIHMAYIELFSEQGLYCAMIEPGDIKDYYYTSDGKKYSFGFAYNCDFSSNSVLLENWDDNPGISSTGYVAKFYFSANGMFGPNDIDKLTFYFGENTVICADDYTNPSFKLGGKETAECQHWKTYEEIIIESTYWDEGIKHVICMDCGNVEKVTIPSIHDSIETKPIDPPIDIPVVPEVCGHEKVYEETVDGVKKTICAVCGEVLSIAPDEPDVCEHGETYEIIVREATCTENGVIQHICVFCKELIAEEEILATDHVFEHVAGKGKAPTCTEAGYEYYMCYGCGEMRVEETAPTGHNEIYEETVDGIKKTICANCGEVLSIAPDEPDVCDHSEIFEERMESTCTENGYIKRFCANCKEVIDFVELPALNHAETYEKIVKEPAINIDGLKHIVCAYCGEVVEKVIIPALDAPEPPFVDSDIIFELGRLVYNEKYNEIEVPLYIVGNNKDIYAAQLNLLSEQGLVCTAIIEGTIKDSFDKGGREGIVEFGFNYTVNPQIGLILVDSAEATRGIASMGLLATFCFEAPEDFKITDLAELTFVITEDLIVSYDNTFLTQELREVYYCYHFETKEVIVKAPTCTENGEKKIVCAACEEDIEAGIVINATGHSFERDEENDVAATCTEDGKIAYKCHCGEIKFEKGSAAKGHSYKLNDGLTCSECRHSKAPAKPEVLEVTNSSVTLAEKDYLEYSLDGINWQSSGVFEGLEAETEYTFFSRVALSETADAGKVSEGVSVTTEAKYAPGDINGDGGVNAADLRILKLLIAQLMPIDDPEVKNTDVDETSGMPNASDLRVLKLLIAKL